MKIKVLIVALSLLLIQGCIFQKAKDLETENTKLKEQMKLQEQSIQMYVTNINDIYRSLQQLREGTDTVSVKAEQYSEVKSTNRNQLASIKDNVNMLNQQLSDFRSKNDDLQKKIAELQNQIGSNSRNNAELSKNVEALSKSNETLNKNNQDLSNNNDKLSKDNAALNDLLNTFKLEAEASSAKINELTTKVTGLETQIAEQQKAIEEQKQVIAKQSETITAKETVIKEQLTKINTLYYIAGPQDELKKQGIIKSSGGFLSKKVYEFSGNSNLDSFNTINVSEQSLIQCEHKILNIIPTLPADSYEINGNEMKILNPDVFCLYKVLVIITDKKN